MRLLVKDIASLAYQDIIRRQKVAPFITFISFLLSFAVARLTVITFPDVALIVREYHIHHFYYGIILISASAWIALVTSRPRMIIVSAIFLGVGLGLITDEFGLLLTCNSEGLACDYFARASFDAAVLLALFFLTAIYFQPFWSRVRRARIWAKINVRNFR